MSNIHIRSSLIKKIIIPIFLLSIFVGSPSFANSLTKDFKYIIGLSSKCLVDLQTQFLKRPDIMVRVMGNVLKPENFSPKTERQKYFSQLLKSSKNKIEKGDQEFLIKFLQICPINLSKIKNPNLQELTLRSINMRRKLVVKIGSNDARYRDISKMFAKENADYEELFNYWFTVDPKGAERFFISNTKKMLSKLEKVAKKISASMKKNFDINIEN